MSELHILTSAEKAKSCLREATFTKDVLLIEIKRAIKAAEFEQGLLISEFTEKFYGTCIDAIIAIEQKVKGYKLDIESSISIFQDALDIQTQIDTSTNELSVLLQSTYDEINSLLQDIESEVKYLQNKIK